MDNTNTLSAVVGERILALRRKRLWSARELADEFAAQGLPPVSEAVIVNVEGRRPAGERRRDITVDEWLRFAQVLGVPPLFLLLPWGQSVDLGADEPADTMTVYNVILGKQTLGPRSAADRRTWQRATEALHWVQEYQDALERATTAYERLSTADKTTPTTNTRRKREHRAACEDLVTAARQLTSRGLKPPRPPASTIGDLDALMLFWPTPFPGGNPLDWL